MHLPDFLKKDWMKRTEIRISKPEEVKELKKLIVEAYTPIEPILGRKPRGMKETEENILERIENKTIFSVILDGDLIASFSLKYNEKYELMEIFKVAVKGEMQNKGIGSFIMETAEHMVRLMEKRKVMIQTYEDHKQLVDFYKHRGYKTFNQMDRFGNNVLMMEKNLWRED